MKRLLFIAFLFLLCVAGCFAQETTGVKSFHAHTFGGARFYIDMTVSNSYNCEIHLKDSSGSYVKVSKFNLLKDLRYNVESNTWSYSDKQHTYIFDRLRRLGMISVLDEWHRFEIYVSRPDILPASSNPFSNK